MNNWNQFGRDDRQDDKPPYSRLFVVCSKNLKEQDLRPIFQKYGKIEDLFIPKDRYTGQLKGVAYIKYSKTSSAANAIENLHMTTIPNTEKPIKVMVASNKNDPLDTNESKYRRIFIKVPKHITESEIRHHFSEFGDVETVRIQRDRITDQCKGFAYVYFKTFLGAATAVEECDRRYKPIFALPFGDLKRSRTSLENHDTNSNMAYNTLRNFNSLRNENKGDNILSLITTKPNNYTTVYATCVPPVPQRFIEKLFNIIPGVTQFSHMTDSSRGCYKTVITFNCEKAAAFSVERINQFEFPSGQIVTVTPEQNNVTNTSSNFSSVANNLVNSIDGKPELLQLANVIAQALIKETSLGKEVKTDIQDNFCNVPLPPPKPFSTTDKVAKRCFVVFIPYPPPIDKLKDAFCRFGDLIDVYTLPGKTFGFAKYASVQAAQDAIKTLHLATVCGVKLKVLEADERLSKDKANDDDHRLEDVETEHDNEMKRMKLTKDNQESEMMTYDY